ncbi:MAG: hypothetical protein JJU06_01750 [Ectothiorhodospiraceae bacterium]|nr:hypothetical protein [Ectothiorhodospiraceae bacterium]
MSLSINTKRYLWLVPVALSLAASMALANERGNSAAAREGAALNCMANASPNARCRQALTKPIGGDEAQTRIHDERSFQVGNVAFDGSAAGLSAAVQAANRYYGTYDGLQGEAAYTVEIPQDWNGKLVMWTRGYGGEGATLNRVVPSATFRNAVLGAGYAWAASSYSANFYDVRAAIEDTNKLALEFTDYVARDWSAVYDEPSQRLIVGVSMGGHTAAAAVERETLISAKYPVAYDGAAPLCQAEQYQFDWLGDYNRVAQHLAGFGDAPYEDFQSYLPAILGTLFQSVSGSNAWLPAPGAGERLQDVATILTGGERPIFRDFGYRIGTWQGAVLGTGGRDGSINGILARDAYDNTDREYRWTTGEITAEEIAFNEQISRVAADSNPNPIQPEGVRWLPQVQGDFSVPVLTMHTLGDFYVPFRHQQLYREGALVNGNADLLVQRAIRAPSHCDFSASEITTAVNDLFAWVNEGVVPGGDEVLDPAVVAADDYGCQFTNNTGSAGRGALPACP